MIKRLLSAPFAILSAILSIQKSCSRVTAAANAINQISDKTFAEMLDAIKNMED